MMTQPLMLNVVVQDQPVDIEAPAPAVNVTITDQPVATAVVTSEQDVHCSVTTSPTDITAQPGQPLAVVTVQGPVGQRGPIGPEGPEGQPGPPGGATQILAAALQGIRDGANTNFVTPDLYRAGTTAVYRNGLRELPDIGYTEQPPDTVVLSVPPTPDDEIVVDYLMLA